jgi:hypothetical protein
VTMDLLAWRPSEPDATDEGSVPHRPTISERWEAFDAAHPYVYETIRRLALDAVREGRKRIGIGELWEVARWKLHVHAEENSYALNNDFRAVVSRLLMEREAELVGVFETRQRKAQ